MGSEKWLQELLEKIQERMGEEYRKRLIFDRHTRGGINL